ncbi:MULTISPECIES: DeoR/GlpR family DNA-binding transcription regulator [unclassified Rhizobium]|uniref:DeoR/GlpR family DNA-binding transcription regulator n=1 Tax=unclassified Rhizobium TaxID=2613769 RepID=UPI0006F9639A|nr:MULTISPECIES: DeoR/GlpR family DNA-binding transcription regulator [unclassified Rhizobium]KQV35700.1 DeoR family transcriptional regulator [Rhizobium sp. Root1212]KRD25807.1 DeoR family transcriptional regulator [Rhizobium sp. Root268]
MQTELLLRERQQIIQDRLKTSGRVLAVDLAREFGVSEDTVRRDLREMAAAGLCERVYGGALPLAPGGTSLARRVGEATERKQALALSAVDFIRDGMTVFFDASSTNLAIARALPADIRLTAVTNTPLIAAALMEKPGIEIILIGGRIDRQVGAAVGATAQREIGALRPDLCILGVCGIDIAAGITAFEYEDAAFKRLAVQQSAAVLVAVTADKVGTSAPHAVVPAKDCTTLIVEEGAAATAVSAFRALGIDVITVKAKS